MNLEVIEVLTLGGEGAGGQQHWSRCTARPRYSLSKDAVDDARSIHRFTCFDVAERVEADHEVLFAGRVRAMLLRRLGHVDRCCTSLCCHDIKFTVRMHVLFSSCFNWSRCCWRYRHEMLRYSCTYPLLADQWGSGTLADGRAQPVRRSEQERPRGRESANIFSPQGRCHLPHAYTPGYLWFPRRTAGVQRINRPYDQGERIVRADFFLQTDRPTSIVTWCHATLPHFPPPKQINRLYSVRLTAVRVIVQ